MPQYSKRGNPRDARQSIKAQYVSRIISRVVPIALCETHMRAPCRHVELERIEIVRGGVSNPIVEVAHRQFILPLSEGTRSKIGEGTCGVLLKIVLQRQAQTLFELDMPFLIAGMVFRSPDIGQRVNEY